MLETLLVGWAYAFILLFARIGALVMLLPGFADPGPPANIRLVFALLLTVVLAPGAADALPAPPSAPMALWLMVMGEVVIGLALGLILRMFTAALATAGQIMATQSGLAMAMAFDPSQQQQGALFGTFLNMAGVALIFSVDLHHGFLRGLAASYSAFTPGVPVAVGDFAALSLSTFTETFAVALQMSAPLLVFGLVFNLGLGVLSRLMPQLQVFFVAMPVNIILGVAIFGLALSGGLLLWLETISAYVSNLV